MGKIDTILFDCDNTLVLSEELAFEGCADLLNRICASKGVQPPPNFTGTTLITEFVGQNFRGMLKSLQARYAFPLTDEEVDEYVLSEEDVVIAKLRESLQPCVGVEAQLEKLAKDGSHLLSVVSSSALRRVQASLDVVGFDKYFKASHVYSAATSLPVPTSKPDPAVYLHAMKDLGVEASQCVAVEDSKSGTTSAARAKIPVIGYIGPYPADKKASIEKTLREAGAGVIMESWDEFPAKLAEIEKLSG